MEAPYNIQSSENFEIWYTQAMVQACDWRDKEQDIGDAIIRRVSCGVALASLSLVGLIDVIGSLALGVLTSPAFIFGVQLPSDLLERGVKGLGACALGLTYLQFLNIFADKLGNGKKSKFDLDSFDNLI